MTMIENRVHAGIALLDERVPRWHERIDLDRLNIRSSSDCVLGQLYSFYGIGLSALHINEHQAIYGFAADAERWTGAELESYFAALTNQWRAMIRERRAELVAV
jgi:hypothetical protein